MFFRILLLLTIVPIFELYLLIKVGSVIGAFNTILIIMITAIIGAYLTKKEGLKVLLQIRTNLEHGIMPTEELVDGVLIFVAGALLLTPGFVTDSIGFLLLIPTTRNLVKNRIAKFIKKKLMY